MRKKIMWSNVWQLFWLIMLLIAFYKKDIPFMIWTATFLIYEQGRETQYKIAKLTIADESEEGEEENES